MGAAASDIQATTNARMKKNGPAARLRGQVGGWQSGAPPILLPRVDHPARLDTVSRTGRTIRLPMIKGQLDLRPGPSAAPGRRWAAGKRRPPVNLQEAKAIVGPLRRCEVKRLAANLADQARRSPLDRRRLAAARLILRHK